MTKKKNKMPTSVNNKLNAQGGDIVFGDKVAGSKIVISDSHHVSLDYSHHSIIKNSFNDIYQKLEDNKQINSQDKEEIKNVLNNIQSEVLKTSDSDPDMFKYWLETLRKMSKDIFDVTIACLTSPATGITTVLAKIAQKVQDEYTKDN